MPHLHHHTFNHRNSFSTISSITQQRFYSSSSSSSTSSSPNQSDPSSTNPNPNSNPEMKHQEIEGPTVERDLSPLANESREVTNSLLKTMYNLSRVLAVLGLAHLCLGTYTYAFASMSGSSPSPLMIQMSVISAIAFGFPFSMAFMLRQSLKSMHFLEKMEQIGRLQILTSTMQISKHLLLSFSVFVLFRTCVLLVYPSLFSTLSPLIFN
ncbi:30S ribosomal protein S2 [Bienertia sinuspersici]